MSQYTCGNEAAPDYDCLQYHTAISGRLGDAKYSQLLTLNIPSSSDDHCMHFPLGAIQCKFSDLTEPPLHGYPAVSLLTLITSICMISGVWTWFSILKCYKTAKMAIFRNIANFNCFWSIRVWIPIIKGRFGEVRFSMTPTVPENLLWLARSGKCMQRSSNSWGWSLGRYKWGVKCSDHNSIIDNSNKFALLWGEA